ncbi:transmembrane protein 53 [Ambystoma mexicanum]|uniref:transmembrane protein 53 n=1 Tax=Ambystoma mexicanum TaxID=8296 RepID=UPI0037E8D3BB
MGDSDLDYTIVFPEPSAHADSRWESEREPVVILLGWGGCKDQYLAKYGTIYHNQGCIVIRYTAPWKMIFFSESFGLDTLREQAKKLLELLFDYEIEKSPILFHVFSNGGFMLYRYVVDLVHSHRQLSTLWVVGTIIDSGPGNRNVRGSVRALDAVLMGSTNVIIRYLILFAFFLMVVVLRVILYPLTRFFHENHYDAMKKEPSRWPQLYLYSKADLIVTSHDVLTMMEMRRQLGVLVDAVDFEDSGHVSHYREYPVRYTEVCCSFLKDSVRRSQGPPKKRQLMYS